MVGARQDAEVGTFVHDDDVFPCFYERHAEQSGRVEGRIPGGYPVAFHSRRVATGGNAGGGPSGSMRRYGRHHHLAHEPVADVSASRLATARMSGEQTDSCTFLANSHCRTRPASAPARPAIRFASPAGSSASLSSQLSMCCKRS